MLTEAQIQRYGRHVLLPKVGGRGQERLLAATVAFEAEGGAAATALCYLAAAGVRCAASPTLVAQAPFLAGRPLAALNPDAAAPAGSPVAVVRGEVGGGDGLALVLRPGGVAVVPSGSCPRCAATLADGLHEPAPPGGDVSIGAWAAVRLLQVITGLEEGTLSAHRLTDAGWVQLVAPSCEHT